MSFWDIEAEDWFRRRRKGLFDGRGGLYISKSIIEEHGGKIWAENNYDGRGATFSFAIPVEQTTTLSRQFRRD